MNRAEKRRRQRNAAQKRYRDSKSLETKAKEMADWRSKLAPEKRQAQNDLNAKSTAKYRANMTLEERQAQNDRDAKAKAEYRAIMTPEECQAQKDRDAEAKAASRNRGKSHVNLKDAMRSQEIMEGKLIVLALEDTEDAIGPMNHVCRWCSALKFKGETMSSCCGGPADGKPPNARPKWYLQAFLYRRQMDIEKLKEEKPVGYEQEIEMLEGLCKGCKVNWCEMYQRCDCEDVCKHVKLSKCCVVKYYELFGMTCKCCNN